MEKVHISPILDLFVEHGRESKATFEGLWLVSLLGSQT